MTSSMLLSCLRHSHGKITLLLVVMVHFGVDFIHPLHCRLPLSLLAEGDTQGYHLGPQRYHQNSYQPCRSLPKMRLSHVLVNSADDSQRSRHCSAIQLWSLLLCRHSAFHLEDWSNHTGSLLHHSLLHHLFPLRVWIQHFSSGQQLRLQVMSVWIPCLR